MATPNQTINYGTKPPAKNLSGSKTAGAMGNPATPTVGSTPPTPSRTPMPVTPMPSTGTTPVTTGGLNSTLQKALGRQTAPAPAPMPVTVAPPPTETVAPVIAEALGTGSLNTSGQYAPGYGPQKGDHVRGKHSGVGKPNAEEIKQFYISQYGGNWQQAMQNQDAFSKAFAQEQAYVDAGRLTPDGKGGQLLDGVVMHMCLFRFWEGVAKFTQECDSVDTESTMRFKSDWDNVVWGIFSFFLYRSACSAAKPGVIDETWLPAKAARVKAEVTMMSRCTGEAAVCQVMSVRLARSVVSS